MQQYQEQLFNDGFCVIPDVISPDIVLKLRTKYLPLFSDDRLTFTAHEILNDHDLSNILFSADIMNIISSIIGVGYCMYPDFTLRSSVYVPWHTDVPYLSQDEANSDLVANMVQVSLYLQDNTFDYGGGLDAILGSHHNSHINPQRLDFSEVGISNSQLIPSISGSLTLWDSRLIHKSSGQNAVNINNSVTKIALQWTVSRNEKFSKQYLQFLSDRIHAKRKDPIYDKTNREIEYLLCMSKLRYPHSFNQDQISLIKNYGIQLKLLK